MMQLKPAHSPGSWMSLPIEIRTKILKKSIASREKGWTSVAAVCKDWRNIIEAENYRRLKLRASCLDMSCLYEFQTMVTRQRPLVRHLQLEIELQTYPCPDCGVREQDAWSEKNSRIATIAIQKLIYILSEWKKTGPLILELNAYSPSDSEHGFKGWEFSLDHVGERGDGTWHDEKHGWDGGIRTTFTPEQAIERLFQPIECSFDLCLPYVPAVTSLVQRRQLRRGFSGDTMKRLFKTFDELEHMVYEPWRELKSYLVRSTDNSVYLYLSSSLPGHQGRVPMTGC